MNNLLSLFKIGLNLLKSIRYSIDVNGASKLCLLFFGKCFVSINSLSKIKCKNKGKLYFNKPINIR